MSDYTLYFISLRSGRFVGALNFEAVDDVDAMKTAREHENDHPLELWCGRRMVAQIDMVVPPQRDASGVAGGSRGPRSLSSLIVSKPTL